MTWWWLVLGVPLAMMLWQHARYVRARRDKVQDRQSISHSAKCFHVVTFLAVAPEHNVIEAVGKLRAQLEASGAKLIYAGQAAFTMPSSQLGPRSWDAAVLCTCARRRDEREASGSLAPALHQ